MKTKIIEVTNGPNWGKFLIGEFDIEWLLRSSLELSEENGPPLDTPLLRQLGWGTQHFLVLDLQTGEGFMTQPLGSASSDLRKHAVWVCPMFEPWLTWLYEQPLDLEALPAVVTFTQEEAPFAMQGYRRAGIETLIRAAEQMDDAWDTYIETDDMDAASLAIGQLRAALAQIKELT